MVLLKSSPSSLVFKVRRKQPELVAPASPTPHELLLLSNLDDQKALRFHLESVEFFPYNPSITSWEDFIHLFKEALSKTLVFYYPFAGRIREGPKDKLMVDCTGEGVLFIQGEADVTLDQFGSDLLPPFPCFDELLYNVPGSDEIIDSPILTIQMTHLKCGGFIFAIRVNHTMCDGSGLGQFTKAITEIAMGAAKPSILPVWCRELLCERNPPRVTCIHHEYDQLPLDNKSVFKPYHTSFFFGPKEIHALRRHLPSHLAESSTTFDIITACLWRCRTAALQWENPNQEVRLLCAVNARHGLCRFNPALPEGYYGNAFVFPAAVSTVGKICKNPLSYALELVKKAKNKASEEYVRSVVDLLAVKKGISFTETGSFIMSDSRMGFRDVDYGFKPLYSGVAKAGVGDFPSVSYYVPHTNSRGEHGTVIPICLPEEAMVRFEEELNEILNFKDGKEEYVTISRSNL